MDEYKLGYLEGYGAKEKEIIKCKHCKEFSRIEEVSGHITKRVGQCNYYGGALTTENDFCSHGEKE